MKFTPLNNQPNISNIGFESVSPSMQLDSRGFPHISWLDKKQGHNTINYRFWDGLKWSELEDSIVDRSEEEIVNSHNSLILENDSPIVAYSRKDIDGSLLTVSYPFEGGWIKSQLSVSYDTKWIGIASIYKLISSSSDSESSSSMDGGNLIISTLDSNGGLMIYKWSKSMGWDNISDFSDSIVDYSKFKIGSTNNMVGFCYLKDDSIYYNFFDTNSESWSFIDFDSVSNLNESIIDFDIDAYSNLDVGVLSLAWLSDGINNFYVRHTNVDSDGNQGIDDSSDTIVHERTKTVQSDTYIVNGFNSISVFNDAFKKPNILASGAETIFYYKDSVWEIDEVDINGSCDGFIPLSCKIKLDDEDNVKFSFSSNGGIYYFEHSEDDGFDMSSPSLVVLNANNLFLVNWKCNNLIGNELMCIYNNKSGDILRESLKKVAVVVNETYDPVCESSSSSSSSS